MLRVRLTELSRQKGWTLRMLADVLGVDYQTVLYWNQGRSYPRLPTMLRLMQLLDCTIDELLDQR